MAAIDTFNGVTAALSSQDRELLREFIREQRADLLAARSEDAMVRLVEEYIKEVHELLRPSKR